MDFAFQPPALNTVLLGISDIFSHEVLQPLSPEEDLQNFKDFASHIVADSVYW